MAANDPSMDVEPGNDHEDFQEVLTPKQRRRGKKRTRIGSLNVENLKGHSPSEYSTDSDTQDLPFQTPRQAPPPKQEDELKILLSAIDKTKNLKNISPLTIAKSIQKVCGSDPVQAVKQISSGILIVCKHIKQYRLLQQIETIGNIPVKVVERQPGVRGIIFGVPLDMSEDEMREELKGQNVIGVVRMTKKGKLNEGIVDTERGDLNRTPMKSVILTFKGLNLPTNVRLCYQAFQVKQYIPQAIRCYKCQRFGHSIQQCRHKERCVRCGEEHNFDSCSQKETPKCVNCGGTHSAAYGGCQIAKTAQAIQKVKIENKISYAQATKMYSTNSNENGAVAPPLEKQSSSHGHNSAPNKSKTLDKVVGESIPSTSSAGISTGILLDKVATQTASTSRTNEIPMKHNQQKTKNNGVKKTLFQEGNPQDTKNNISIDDGEKFINLIMALISVFIKDNNQIDELYNINMIKVAAERLLQIKEKAFINDENY